MIAKIVATAVALAAVALATNPVHASDGALDQNGCHYDRQGNGAYHCHEDRGPNPDRFANVKKTRENMCIDKRNANYRTTSRFVAYRTMGECVRSGGVETFDESGGLRNKPWG